MPKSKPQVAIREEPKESLVKTSKPMILGYKAVLNSPIDTTGLSHPKTWCLVAVLVDTLQLQWLTVVEPKHGASKFGKQLVWNVINLHIANNARSLSPSLNMQCLHSITICDISLRTFSVYIFLLQLDRPIKQLYTRVVKFSQFGPLE